MRRERTAGGRGAWQRALLALAYALLLLAGPIASGDVLDGTLEVRSAFVTVDNGVYQLTAHIAYPVSEEVRKALKDGITLSFDLEVMVQKLRRYWTNSTVVDLTLRRELSWHVVTERYIVRDVEHGETGSYATLEQALAAIGSVENWPVVVEPQLQADGTYEIGVRASVRRGTLPSALRALIWWSDSWQRSSEWYQWSLPR
jgi:Domain of unknown function (DUF4390)